MRIRVIGVGTRRGDDAAGLEAAGRLARGPLPPGVEVVTCERPAPDLVEALAGVDAAVVLDATRSGGPPGLVRRVALEEIRRAAALSSHGLGVGDALALAEALGHAPARLALLGIEAGDAEGEELSPAVRQGVEEAAARVRALLEEMLRDSS